MEEPFGSQSILQHFEPLPSASVTLEKKNNDDEVEEQEEGDEEDDDGDDDDEDEEEEADQDNEEEDEDEDEELSRQRTNVGNESEMDTTYLTMINTFRHEINVTEIELENLRKVSFSKFISNAFILLFFSCDSLTN